MREIGEELHSLISVGKNSINKFKEEFDKDPYHTILWTDIRTIVASVEAYEYLVVLLHKSESMETFTKGCAHLCRYKAAKLDKESTKQNKMNTAQTQCYNSFYLDYLNN